MSDDELLKELDAITRSILNKAQADRIAEDLKHWRDAMVLREGRRG